MAVTGTVALVAAWVARTLAGWALWQAVALVLAVMVVPASITWRATAQRYGLTAAIAGALVTVQGLHSIEHGVQWVQRHVMHQPLRLSNGLLSPANSEWVHFVWNWLVLLTVIVLFVRGMRGWWGWAILLFATAHTLEHTYMWVRFLQVSAELRELGQGGITAQGLPGVVGPRRLARPQRRPAPRRHLRHAVRHERRPPRHPLRLEHRRGAAAPAGGARAPAPDAGDDVHVVSDTT